MSAIIDGISDAIDFLQEGFNETTKTIKNFGLEVGGFFADVGEFAEASFDYVKETGETVFDFSKNLILFGIQIIKEIIRLIPTLIELLESLFKLSKYIYVGGIVILLLAPALTIYYQSVYLVQLLERRY